MSGFKDKVEKILEDDIRPVLAMHGGGIKLEDADEENKIVKISFAGACHGCPNGGVTFQHVIEKTLLEELPEIKEILLVDDHSI